MLHEPSLCSSGTLTIAPKRRLVPLAPGTAIPDGLAERCVAWLAARVYPGTRPPVANRLTDKAVATCSGHMGEVLHDPGLGISDAGSCVQSYCLWMV